MKRKGARADSISTFLGADARVEGSLTFEGTVRLDGQLKGNITSQGGTVIVGEKALVEDEIRVATAVVMGEVVGTIAAGERIEVYPPARIVGDLEAPVIAIEEGARFNGRCTMTEIGHSPQKLLRIAEKSEPLQESGTH